MADDFRGVPLSPEVNSFKAEIGSNQGLMALWDLEDSAVVADSSRDRPASGSRAAANTSYQQFFVVRQSAPSNPDRNYYTS
jgi:hypothetical protein